MHNKKIAIFIFSVLNLLLFDIVFAQQSNEYVDLNGELEVLHVDDFEHPENSKYIFYLRAGEQRYELVSDTQLPVVRSGTLANVKGRLYEGKIIVEDLAIQPQSTALTEQEQNLLSEDVEEETKAEPISIKWVYIAIPLILIVVFLGYLEIKRLKDHQQMTQQHMQQKNLALRNYVTTNLKKGYTKQQIRNALIKNNYTSKEIEEAFKGIG